MTAPRSWLEDEQAQGRYTGRFGGVDHGAAGRVLAEVRRGNETWRRLIWFKGYKTPAAGVRGFGHVYVPARLQVVDKDGYNVAGIADGGRLSRGRLDELAAEIDRHMGNGIAASLTIGKTLVRVDD